MMILTPLVHLLPSISPGLFAYSQFCENRNTYATNYIQHTRY